MSEMDILFAAREALVATGQVLLWRNNTGFDRERKVKYGLGLGGADLVGLVRSSGKFLSVEVKTPPGRLSPEQRLWREAVQSAGGVYILARSVDEALRGLEGHI